MKTNEKKKLSPLKAADLPTGSYPPSQGYGGQAGQDSASRRSSPGLRGAAWDGGASWARRPSIATILLRQGCGGQAVMSRTAGGDMLFDPEAKEAFCKIMRRLENFAGVEIP